MLFNSYSFLLVFLPVTVLGFFLAGRLGKAAGAGWLAACSLFFYAWWDYRYLVLLVASICANYLVGTGHSENSDNILASREYPMRVRLTGESRLLDGEWEIPNGSEIDKWPQGCWLFHDLVDHAYGPNNPKLALRKIDAIGTIWIDVIVRQQYCLDTRTGKWEQYHVDHWGN